MPEFRWDHLHLRSCDPEATAQYYVDVFGATPVTKVDVRGAAPGFTHQAYLSLKQARSLRWGTVLRWLKQGIGEPDVSETARSIGPQTFMREPCPTGFTHELGSRG